MVETLEASLARQAEHAQRLAAALLEREELLNMVINTLPDPVFVKDRHGRYELINETGARILGRPVAEVLGRTDADFFTAEDARRMIRRENAIMRSGKAETCEDIDVINGVRRVWLSSKAPYRDQQGAIAGIVGLARDITTIKTAQAAMEATTRRLRGLHTAALTLAQTEPIEAGEVSALLGTIVAVAIDSLRALRGRLLLQDEGQWPPLLQVAVPGSGYLCVTEAGHVERQIRRPGSAQLHVLTSGEPVFVPDILAASPFGPFPARKERGARSFALAPLRSGGQVIGALDLEFAEVTEWPSDEREAVELFAAHVAAALDRVRVASQREELIRREGEATALRELDRLKNEFLRTISHELRTPLALIHGYAELLQGDVVALGEANLRRVATHIYESTTQLTRLVDDLLDFERIERGELMVQPIDFDLAPLLAGLVGSIQRQQRGERVSWQCAPELVVRADPARVTQVVTNLVENALKYAPCGPVTIRAFFSPLGSKGGTRAAARRMIRIEVRDQGPGIVAEEQARVWEKFYRGTDVAGLCAVPGSGIGLAVVKALVEAQKGRVGLQSAPGEGACFWCEFPLGE